jgi:hypothetical protein
MTESTEPDFHLFYTQQYERHHDRLGKVEDQAGKTEVNLQVAQGRISVNSQDIKTLRRELYGNGHLGYVDRQIQRNNIALAEKFTRDIKEAIHQAFEARAEKERLAQAEKAKEVKQEEKQTRDKWDARTWMLFMALVGVILNLLQRIFFP